MKTEKQHRTLILLSIIKNNGYGTKKEILDYLLDRNYIKLTDHDRRILDSRPEEWWQNSLAYGRQHLKQEGYLLSELKDKWEISLQGLYECLEEV